MSSFVTSFHKSSNVRLNPPTFSVNKGCILHISAYVLVKSTIFEINSSVRNVFRIERGHVVSSRLILTPDGPANKNSR